MLNCESETVLYWGVFATKNSNQVLTMSTSGIILSDDCGVLLTLFSTSHFIWTQCQLWPCNEMNYLLLVTAMFALSKEIRQSRSLQCY